MILITGATGHLGKATIHQLLEKGILSENIAALVRDVAKAEDLSALGISLRTGDYRDYASLVQAFTGIEKLLLVSSSDMSDRTTQHLNAIRAAKEAGVKHIVYTSFQRKNEISSPIQFISESHLAAEKEIKASGMTYTILQNGLYADFIPSLLGENVLQTGISLPAGEGKAAFTIREDLAEAAANVIAGSGHENKVYLTATNETSSFYKVAEILSEIAGKAVNYKPLSTDEFKAGLTQAGVPEVYIQVFSSFCVAISQGEFDSPNNDLEQLLSRKPTSLSSFLTKVYSKN